MREKTIVSALVLAGLASGAAGGTWTKQFVTDLSGQLQNEGTLIIATNAGAGAGALDLNIAGIDFGLDESALSRITNNTDTAWLTGSESADEANLLGTGHRVAEWTVDEIIDFGAIFEVGKQYRLQLVIGHAYDWAAVNLYAPDGTFYYNPDNDVNGVAQATLATYDWVASDTSQVFIMDVGTGQGRVNLLGYALHEVPAPSALALLGIAVAAPTRRRR